MSSPMMNVSRSMSPTQLAGKTVGRGFPLVLLHGGTGSWTHWTRNIDKLASSFQVHALDLPGFGHSPNVPADTSADRYIDWVAAAISDYTRNQKYHLAGFSFGAVIAAGIAARDVSRISALTLIGPGGFGNPAGRRLDVRSLRADGSPQDRRDVMRHNLLQIMLANSASVDDRTLDIQAENIRNARFDSRRISLQARLLNDLGSVTVPLQLIWGALDHLAYPSIAARADLCRGVRPEARVDIIPSAGHWVQYEQPAVFNEALLSFAGGNPEHPRADARPQICTSSRS